MPTEQYGTTQVKEIRFSKAEVHRLIIENLYARMDHPYDFDYKNPILVEDGNGGVVVRYVQSTITCDSASRLVTMQSLKQKTNP